MLVFYTGSIDEKALQKIFPGKYIPWEGKESVLRHLEETPLEDAVIFLGEISKADFYEIELEIARDFPAVSFCGLYILPKTPAHVGVGEIISVTHTRRNY